MPPRAETEPEPDDRAPPTERLRENLDGVAHEPPYQPAGVAPALTLPM